MELKDSIDTDTGRFCGDCYREITRDLTDEERERISVPLWRSDFRTSSLWLCGISQVIAALVLVADPGADSLMLFGALLLNFAAYALGVLMEVYGVRRRTVLILAVLFEVTGAFLWIASWVFMATTKGVPQFPIGVLVIIPIIPFALATIRNLVRAYEGAPK